MTSPLRFSPITYRDKASQIISSSLTREAFDRLDKLCRKLAITKSEFIRKVVEAELAQFDP